MANILVYDIETSPNIGYCWGKYDQDIMDYAKEWEILSVAWKWYGEKKVFVRSQRDFEGTEKGLCQLLWELFDDADIVVAHNGDQFDQKKVRSRLLYHGFGPPSPFAEVDTRKIAKKYFRFNSNRLDDLGKHLGLGEKASHPGLQMWIDCMAGKTKAWKQMEKYNKQDVVLLDKVYTKLLPWVTNHPSVALLNGSVGCPNCGSSLITRQGVKATKKSLMQQFKCKECLGWFSLPAKLSKKI